MKLHEAIYQLNPSIITIRGDVAYDADGDVVEYNKAAAEALIEANQYKQQRAFEYPPLAEQLDMLWHAMEQDPTKRLEPFYSSIKDIKDAYPK